MRTHTRSMLRAGLTVVGVACAALAVAAPANAAESTGTFVISAGTLTITAPSAVSLGTGAESKELDSALGSVTVTDTRASLVAAWTATVSSSPFTTGGKSAAETIPNSDIAYWSGPATATTGSGTFTPGQATRDNRVPLSAPVAAFSLTGGVSSNSATWHPSIAVSVPAEAVAGTYTGTITHSVA